MKVLHLAAGNRWTGAAAPAFAEVAALREAGIDAHYAYVGGYKLEQKIGHLDFAHAIIEKAQHPLSFLRSVRAIRRLIDEHSFDILHAHLTYDHWLAVLATRRTGVRIARTFHSRRVLRGDPFTRSLIARSNPICVVNDTFRDAAMIRHRHPVFTPPPVNLGEFYPDGVNVRESYGLPADAKVAVVIGKVAHGRGFEDALFAFATLRGRVDGSRLLVIGHGERRPALEVLASTLGIAGSVVWAGYHEEDLAEHYRAADVMLFTAAGSDEGHRAVLEAMACGVPPVSYPIPGVSALLGDLAPALVSEDASPDKLAGQALSAMEALHLRQQVRQRAGAFGFERAARRLIDAYESNAGPGVLV